MEAHEATCAGAALGGAACSLQPPAALPGHLPEEGESDSLVSQAALRYAAPSMESPPVALNRSLASRGNDQSTASRPQAPEAPWARSHEPLAPPLSPKGLYPAPRGIPRELEMESAGPPPPLPDLPPPPPLLGTLMEQQKKQPPQPHLPPPPEMPGLWGLPHSAMPPPPELPEDLSELPEEQRDGSIPPPPTEFFEFPSRDLAAPPQPSLPPPPTGSSRLIIPRLDLAKLARHRGHAPVFPQVSPSATSATSSTGTCPSPHAVDETAGTGDAKTANGFKQHEAEGSSEDDGGAQSGHRMDESESSDETRFSEWTYPRYVAYHQHRSLLSLFTCAPMGEVRRKLFVVAVCLAQVCFLLLALDAGGIGSTTLRNVDLHHIPVAGEVSRVLAWFCAALALVTLCYCMAMGHNLVGGQNHRLVAKGKSEELEGTTPLAPKGLDMSPEELCELGEAVAATVPAGRDYREMLRMLQEEVREARAKLKEPDVPQRKGRGARLARAAKSGMKPPSFQSNDTSAKKPTLRIGASGKLGPPGAGVNLEPDEAYTQAARVSEAWDGEPGGKPRNWHFLSRRPARGAMISARSAASAGTTATGSTGDSGAGGAGGRARVHPSRAARITAASQASAGSRVAAAAARRTAAGIR